LFHALGGDVSVEFKSVGSNLRVYMTGGAARVFSGSVEV
jgi:diaminopimelate epimerase